MSIRERRPGIWQIRAYAGVDASGKPQYVYKTFSGTKSEARKEELKLKGAAGVMPRGSNREALTLEQFTERWLSLYVEPNVRPFTVVCYRGVLQQHILPVLGSYKLQDIKADAVQRVFNALLLSPNTKAHTRIIFSMLMKRARKLGLIADNPCEDLVLPPVRVHHVRSLTPDEARRFLKVCEKHRDGFLLSTALLTGLRKSELLKLRWEHVDLVKGIIAVREGGSVAGETKSEAGRRDVVMPRYLLERMNAEFIRDEQKHMETPTWNPDRCVFPSIHGKYRPGTGVASNNLRSALKRAGIDLPGFRFHDLRHSHGSLLLDAGVALPAIQERLGHASLQTTVAMYLHPDGSAGAKISEYLDKVAGPEIIH